MSGWIYSSDMSQFESHENKVSAESVPDALVERDRWVCWRYEQGGDKKPPYDPKTDEGASIREPETWAEFETALNRYRRGEYDGIGFVLTDDGPFAGVDFDYCRDPDTEEIQQEVEEIIGRFASYAEISPSKTGLHALAIGEKPEGFGSRSGDGIEVYDSGQYFTVTGEHLEETPGTIERRNGELRAICEEHLSQKSSKRQTEFSELPEDSGNTEEVEEARGYIRDFLHAQETGPRPPDYFTDLLKGRYADRGFEDDRSGAETTLCSLIYGIFLDGGAEPERARELTYHYITHVAKKNPYTTSKGELRKWLEGSPDHQRNYRQRTLDYAIRNFDPEIWDHWRQSGHRTDTDDYCEHAYEVALDALYNLTVEHALSNPPTLSTNNTPETCGYREHENPYPTLGQIAERAQEEYELSEDSYREILRRIRRDGGAKMARLGSSTYVYYPASYPDPDSACYVRVEGEKRDPEPASESTEEATEKQMMTDGGENMSKSESHDKLDQIRRARSGDQTESDSAEVLTCPLCDQPMLSEGSLRNHVANSNDADHQYRTLDGDLKVETAWAEMNWGSGAPK